MQPRTFPPLVEAFLIVEQPRQRLSHWSQALAPLDDRRAPALATVAAYYDPSRDQALLGLRYDELALGRDRLAFLIDIAEFAEVDVIQPAELSEFERQRFLAERLGRCTLQVLDQRSVVRALTELSRRVRDHKLASKTVIGSLPQRPRGMPPPIPAARASLNPRGTTEDPVLLVTPKSTRDLPSIVDPAPRAAPPVRPTSRHVIARATIAHRASTVELSPIESRRMSEQLVERPSAPVIRPAPVATERAQRDSEPYLPTSTAAMPLGIIYARYLRSGRWVPIRIGALSLKGATLMAGVLPRLHDEVDVAFSFGDHRALVRGPVKKLSTPEEAAMSGVSTFSVAFGLDEVSHRELVTLLTAARSAQVLIKPPPPRGARRYPVEWPVCLGTMRGTLRADALDVSRDGMFVRPSHPLMMETTLTFSTLLDDGGPPITGYAKVVRQVQEPAARACGLVPGYGLHITDIREQSLTRWTQFLQRIEKRADKRVLIGAAPERMSELQTSLAAAGYAVTGGTDPTALVQLAGAERPVDAVLIDGAWLASGNATTRIEELFSARNVPCVTMYGDARRGRSAIDKLLL
ncbi:MAG: hypothetical protein H6Q90_5454 [Deltaproteobacteria bacterium]|nr:hypothetical protein [Deltaproteobacteria bacterium]